MMILDLAADAALVSSHFEAVARTAAQHVGDWATGTGRVLAGPPPVSPSVPPATKELNTDGIVGFFATRVTPILLAVLGVIFVGRASRGNVSGVLTASSIAIIGLVFIAGAGGLFFFGGSIIDLLFK
jgi:hypothetical protein